MARAFKSTSRGISGTLHAAERRLMRELFADVISMLQERQSAHELPEDLDPLYALTGMRPEHLQLPPITDAALGVLLPDASKDPQVAAEHRRMTEADLISAKLGRLREAQLLLENDKIVLDPPAAQRFAQALNDLRLVLASRLEIRDEADSERVAMVVDAKDVATAEDYLALVYNLVSWVQDTLMQALMDAEY